MPAHLSRRALLAGSAAMLAGPPARAQTPAASAFRPAAEYNAQARGVSMLVMHGGRVAFEDYPNGGGPDRARETASGAKSFCGVMAAAAVQDRLLALDEPAALTLPEWRDDPLRSRITVRQILNLTSGLRTRRARGDLLTYAEAMELPAVAEPGARFAYGGDPFQVFGELMRRKLRGEDPVSYLRRRVLTPIGVEPRFWRTGEDGMPHLGSGAHLTAGQWAAFGEFVRLGGRHAGRALVDPAALEENFRGSAANPAYGLSWWLNRPMPDAQRAAIPQLVRATDVRPEEPAFPRDLVLAAGAGKQRLYVSRQLGVVVVRQAGRIRQAMAGEATGFSDAEFWRLLRPAL